MRTPSVTPVGKIDPAIAGELARSETFWPWLTGHLHNRDFPKNRRDVFAMAMFQVAADHQATIVSAVRAVRFSSALALVRSLCEAVVMGMWIRHVASDDVLEAMAQGRCTPPSLDKLIKQLDKVNDRGFFDRPMFDDVKPSLERMHAFTHGGLRHIASRYMGKRVGANYTPDDVVWALRTADLFAVLSALEAAAVVGDQELGDLMYRESSEWLGLQPSAVGDQEA